MGDEKMNATKHDIHERIYQFILKVFRFISKLPKTFTSQQIIGQLIRSVTSMGANDQEANGTFTKADFIHCYTTVRKEGNESLFWIRLLGDCNPVHFDEAKDLLKEGDEIVRIVTAIIINTKKIKQ
ncbi:four helix bundle protein [Candidatus Gottesmanbacteria bacterium]|nr:four helix bundle protein [Candidatus Gottesmanbacteria bacterium]